jgi:hypothetical protein
VIYAPFYALFIVGPVANLVEIIWDAYHPNATKAPLPTWAALALEILGGMVLVLGAALAVYGAYKAFQDVTQLSWPFLALILGTWGVYIYRAGKRARVAQKPIGLPVGP